MLDKCRKLFYPIGRLCAIIVGMEQYEFDQEESKAALARALRVMKAKQDKLTDAAIADRTGLSKATFGRYFRGEREPNMSQLFLLAEALGTTPVEIIVLAQQLLDEKRAADAGPKTSPAARPATR